MDKDIPIILFILTQIIVAVFAIYCSKRNERLAQEKDRAKQEEKHAHKKEQQILCDKRDALFKKACERFCPIMGKYIDQINMPIIIDNYYIYKEYGIYFLFDLIKNVKIKYIYFTFKGINRVGDVIRLDDGGYEVTFKETGPFKMDGWEGMQEDNKLREITDAHEHYLWNVNAALRGKAFYHNNQRGYVDIFYKEDYLEKVELVDVRVIYWDNSEETFRGKDILRDSIIENHPLPVSPFGLIYNKMYNPSEQITILQAYLNGEEPQYYDSKS